MKILLASKFYYHRGGDCIYAINLEKLLKAHGHEVAVFAMRHPENLPSRWSDYWPSEISVRPSSNIMETLARPFGSKEVRQKFSELLDAFQPDVVHANIIHTHLSPIILEIAKSKGIRTVWTMHEYKLLCPRYVCLRDGKPCELCFLHGGCGSKRWHDLLRCVRHRCMKESWAYSFIGYLEALYWHPARLQNITDAFVCPSRFMAEKMMQGGFPTSYMHVLHNFVNAGEFHSGGFEKSDYYCYVGRLTEEKGVESLIKAANVISQCKLVIVGEGPAKDKLRNMAMEHVTFVGGMAWEDLRQIVSRARFTVLPSEWYENCPLSVIESLCLGTPVLAARIGGIPELIDEPSTGLTFESGNTDDLKCKITQMFEMSFNYENIASTSRIKYDAKTYYRRIMDIYTS